MVNFGGHFRAIRDGETKGTDLYLVPYNVIKRVIYDNPAEFEQEWNNALEAASNDFSRAMHRFWRDIFTAIAKLVDANDSVRGAPPKLSLQLFLGTEGPDVAHEMLTRLTQIHTTALTNSEGLRKLVKKYDKVMDMPKNELLSSKLLPILYSTNPHVGQASLEDTICILRALLELEEGTEEGSDFVPMKRHDSDASHARANKHRMEELKWLKNLADSIPPKLIGRLVAHRGFHHIKDRNDKRPIENSLAAFELAWTSGVHLCECDIALTKDEKLVLAHDDDFKRLALDSSSVKSTMRVSDLTFKELISLPLKSGVRPPLLIDVLRSAHAISDNARLIIEIKPGNSAAASALARLLLRHPDLCSCVAMIMSFDAVMMHRLRAELCSVEASTSISASPSLDKISSHLHLNGQLGSHHRQLKSYDHFGILSSSPSLGHLQPAFGTDRSIGLNLSQIGLDLRDSNHPDSETQQRSNHSATVEEKKHNESSCNPGGVTMPKLMLLTVCEEPKKHCEMEVSIEDLSPVDGWLTKPQWSLDGVYMQFQEEMLTQRGAEAVRRLSEKFLVGVWGYSGSDPDDYDTFERLVNGANISFVNTDLPINFRQDIGVKRTALK